MTRRLTSRFNLSLPPLSLGANSSPTKSIRPSYDDDDDDGDRAPSFIPLLAQRYYCIRQPITIIIMLKSRPTSILLHLPLYLTLRTHRVAAGTGPSLTVVSPVNSTDDIKSTLAGSGINITSLVVRCQTDLQVGLFYGGDFDLGMDEGVVISTAYAVTAKGPNDNSYGKSTMDALGGPGSAMLDNLLEPDDRFTKDACVLDIKFTCQDPSKFELNFVFGSEEYPSNGTIDQEDLMGAFLNGVAASNNIATVSGDYISVNTIPSGSGLLKSNQNGAYNVEMNAFTKVLTAKATASDGTNRLFVAVADGGKSGSNTRPSWVFIEKDSMKCPSSTSSGGAITPGNGAKITAQTCAAKIVHTSCACRDWQCIDAHVRTICRTTQDLSQADFISYLRSVRSVFRSSSFKKLYC